MKILLGISILLNIFLGVLYFQEKNKPPLERFVMESKPKIIREKVIVEKSVPSKPKLEKGDSEPAPPSIPEIQEYEEQVEQMEAAKRDFLVTLNVPEEKIKKQERIRQKFQMETGKIYGKNPMGEPNLSDKKEILRLEEDYQTQMVKLYGKDNWEKLEKFRQKYNESVMKKMREENTPAILMAP